MVEEKKARQESDILGKKATLKCETLGQAFGIPFFKGGKMRLKDKVAIITAAGTGSGRAGARLFAKEGATVVVGDIAPKVGEETVQMIQDDGGKATFVRMDAGKVEDMRRLIDGTIKKYGKIDILWNHAGIPGPGIIEETEETAFDQLLHVNLKGGFFAAKFVIPHMKKANYGSIIFTSSTSALRASPWSPSYSMSKGGLISLTYSLSVYLAPFNVRVNAICPGIIDSPMARVFFNRSGQVNTQAVEKAIQSYGENTPRGRVCMPEDVAQAALFLASDEAQYISGVILPVDGGLINKY
jgi:NAD(P)-dependent dehydrogenase (short-subunit alcohol dehydrogenase family)